MDDIEEEDIMQFDLGGKVKRVPAKLDLQTYPVKRDEGKVYIGLLY